MLVSSTRTLAWGPAQAAWAAALPSEPEFSRRLRVLASGLLKCFLCGLPLV